MITYLLIKAVLVILSVFTIWLPRVDVLPWGVDGALVNGVAILKKLGGVYPMVSTVLTAFLIYVAFRISLLVLKFFLGSRTPSHS